MPAVYLSKLTLPVNVGGTVQNVEYTIKDAEARELIEAIGHAIYWIGVTTDALTDGATTNPITVGGESVTAKLGGMASYSGSEFVWNGSAWQELGKNNFGALAFKNNASATYTPAGTVSQPTTSIGANDTADIYGVDTEGTAPSWTVSGETATFNPGAVTTRAASATSVVKGDATFTTTQPTFSGTETTITVS